VALLPASLFLLPVLHPSEFDADIRVLRDDEVDQVDDTAINATRRVAFALNSAAQQPIR
jgi:hypothetical protein